MADFLLVLALAAVVLIVVELLAWVRVYDFPQPHWKSLRTSNVVESPFAAVRLRTAAAKRFQKVTNATVLIWKVLLVAEQTFRRIDGCELIEKLVQGVPFVDGREVLPPSATSHGATLQPSAPRGPSKGHSVAAGL